MKNLVLYITLIFTAGLLTAGTALGAGQANRNLVAQSMDTSESGHMQNEAAAVPLSQEQITRMQTLLNDNGYRVGQEDGVVGSRTTDAIKSFQHDQGLAETGVPDRETLKALAPSAQDQEFFGLAPAFNEETPSDSNGQ